MKTKVNIHMLPTKDISPIFCIGDWNRLYSSSKIDPNADLSADESYQHLYITLPKSELAISKIKENDWLLKNHEIGQVIKGHQPELRVKWLTGITTNFEHIGHCEKIIATTNTLLKVNLPQHNDFDREVNLPGISKDFIRIFITKFNGNTPIYKAKVELEILGKYGQVLVTKLPFNNETNSDMSIYSEYLKLNSNDEISIKCKEPKYSKKEFMNALHQVELKDKKNYSKLWDDIKQQLK